MLVGLGVIPGTGVELVATVVGHRLERIDFAPDGGAGAAGRTEAVGEAASGTDEEHRLADLLRGAVGAYLRGEVDDVVVGARLVDTGHVGASPFARRVYAALGEVPCGGVVTYAELARRSGHAGAARAVGTAMSGNPLPLVVPCHRVVPASGGVGGYRGGPAVKAWLLDREGVQLP